jgi:peptidoglycan-associated lipoprotein
LKNTQSALLASLVAALIVGGCASNTPTVTSASPSQSGTAPQSATAAASARPAAATSTVAPSSSTVATPIGSAVYFEYDSYTVKDQDANVVRSNADYLVKTNGPIELDGNADERGSREYNMALGQKRADAVKRALTVLGVKADRVETISFGEDKPKSKGSNEAAWAENRRVDFVSKGK